MIYTKWNTLIAVIRLWFLPIILGTVWILMFIFIALPGDLLNIFFDGFANNIIVKKLFIETDNGAPKLYIVLLFTLMIDIALLSAVISKNLATTMLAGSHKFVFIFFIILTVVATISQEYTSTQFYKAESNINDNTLVTENTNSKTIQKDIEKLKNINDIVTNVAFAIFIFTAIMIKATSFVRWDNCKKINEYNYTIDNSYSHEEKEITATETNKNN